MALMAIQHNHAMCAYCTRSGMMSWRKGRRVTRIEDHAYSLLGLFNVHMPIVYGEGEAAIQRLQREMMGSADQTSGLRPLAVDTKPLFMETFVGNTIPQYAILSHTWGRDEVSFQDVLLGNAARRVGYRKIVSGCKQARKDGYKYLWVDTCCINKSSSAELQEAICSMYKWYQQAEVCYVYLEDFVQSEPANEDSGRLGNSRWFTRGWTLQELIASQIIKFFTRHWTEFGTKRSLRESLARITRIDEGVLRGNSLDTCSVAEKMSWASSRSTTRTEDLAYSLMGLFNVFMPMLYGEGDRAFARLQEEIMKKSEDHTIFAWRRTIADGETSCGILAKSPADFSHIYSKLDLGRTLRSSLQRYYVTNHLSFTPATLSSRGLEIALPVLPIKMLPESGQTESGYPEYPICKCEWFHPLNPESLKSGETKWQEWQAVLALVCCREGKDGVLQPLYVFLRRCPDGLFARFGPDSLKLLPWASVRELKIQTITIHV